MATLTMRHVRWAAEECHWQQSGEPSVAWMLDGWTHVMHSPANEVFPPTLALIQQLGAIVEPRHNDGGFRSVDVRVGYSVKMPHADVPAAMEHWVAYLPEMTPTVAFERFEEIHPFRDGNGRTGSIIFNVLNSTLHEPVHPPNLWNDPRRYEGEVRA